jgi:hypothetical protein
MPAKRKKKKPPGGTTGAPPRSEPRVQIFTKFAGCNFQLAARDFNHLFDEDQDAQTDLMPMLMAIQNNASIAPFGGIETRQNLVKLFDAPAGKHLTGVSTLIGDRLYAACDDMTVRHGALPSIGVGDLNSIVDLTDSNESYNPAIEYPYSGAVEAGTEFVAEQNITAPSTVDCDGELIGQVFQINSRHRGVSFKYHNLTSVQQTIGVSLFSMGSSPKTIIHTVHFSVAANYDGEVRATWDLTLPPGNYFAAFLPGGDGELYYGSNDPATGYVMGYAAHWQQAISPWQHEGWVAGVDLATRDTSTDLYFKSWEDALYSFTSVHTVLATGLFMKARYSVAYSDGSPYLAHVSIYHGAELIYTGMAPPDSDLGGLRDVELGDTITMMVQLSHAVVNDAWMTSFYESVEDNTWTFLGYADDQLVGMTANKQLWNGPIGDFELANALTLANPSALAFSDLICVPVNAPTATPPVIGITIADHATTTEPFRITVSYTILNEFGPTLPSPPLTFYASKPTTEWTTAKFVKVSGTVPNFRYEDTVGVSMGVVAVELYYTEGEYQEPAFLGRVNIPDITTITAPATTIPATKPWSFNWTGYQVDTSQWAIANLVQPTQNYTTGAPASQMAVLDGQLYFWGGEPRYRIWIGGGPGNRFSVSPGTGGGFVDVEPGTGTVVRDVLKFKTQQGAAIVTCLCDNVNSQRENRFNLVESTISISDEQSVKGWQAEKIAGAVGCKSSHGAVAAGDGLYAVSRYGLAITTLTMEYNSQLQVMYISDPIAPVFLKQYGHQLDMAILFEVAGVLYMAFGAEDGTLDNVIFCYDIALKAWWTYTLDIKTPILNMIHIDYEGAREGIGIITGDAVFLMPTTRDEGFDVLPIHDILIESGELTTMQPLQSMHHLAQLEFRFDYFIGEMDVTVEMIDQFGRTITTARNITHDTLQHQLSEYIRIDAVVESYKIVMRGPARMRLTHFIAKLYPKSNRIGMSWGFDSQQSHTSPGSIHRTFSSYNDLKEAIIP